MFESMIPKDFCSIDLEFKVYGTGALHAMLGGTIEPLRAKYDGSAIVVSQAASDQHTIKLSLCPLPVLRDDCCEEVFKFLKLDCDFPLGYEHAIKLMDISILSSSISPIESKFITGMVEACNAYRSAIIGCYSQMNQLEDKFQSLVEKVKSLTIYNHEVINRTSVQQAIIKVAEHAGMESDDLFPSTIHRIH